MTGKLHISKYSKKWAYVPSLSIIPGRSCSQTACNTCLKQGCIGLYMYETYKLFRTACDANTDLAENDLPTMEKELNKFFDSRNPPRFFRLHVAGDFFSLEYTKMWMRVAESHPNTWFLAFTKQWEFIRAVELPNNFALFLSAWPGTEIPADLAEKYTIAYVDDGTVEIPSTAALCPGNCSVCGMCWSFTRMKWDVVFCKL